MPAPDGKHETELQALRMQASAEDAAANRALAETEGRWGRAERIYTGGRRNRRKLRLGERGPRPDPSRVDAYAMGDRNGDLPWGGCYRTPVDY